MMYYQNIVSILFVDLASTIVWYDLDISVALLAKQTMIALLWPVEKTITIPISKQWKCWICNNGADLVHGHNGWSIAIHKEYCWSLVVVHWMSWNLTCQGMTSTTAAATETTTTNMTLSMTEFGMIHSRWWE